MTQITPPHHHHKHTCHLGDFFTFFLTKKCFYSTQNWVQMIIFIVESGYRSFMMSLMVKLATRNSWLCSYGSVFAGWEFWPFCHFFLKPCDQTCWWSPVFFSIVGCLLCVCCSCKKNFNLAFQVQIKYPNFFCIIPNWRFLGIFLRS